MKLATQLLACALCAVIPNLQAQITYDGFSTADYNDGETIDGLGGGENWSDNWSVNTSGSFNNIHRYHGSNFSLNYTDNFGNSLVTDSGSLELKTAGGGAGEAGRTLGSSANGDVWVSFLNIRTSSENWNWAFEFHDSTSSQSQLLIQNWSDQNKFRLNQDGATSVLDLDNRDLSGTPEGQLYLLHISNVGSGLANSDITLWGNPNNLEDLSAGAEAVTSLSNRQVDSFDTFIFDKGVNPTGFFDELRIGETSAEVLPIPEPRVYALMAGLLSLAFVIVRKRRSTKGE